MFEKPIASQQSHLASLRSGVLSPFEVPVLCSTMFGVFPLRGGPLSLAKTLANQMTSSRGCNEETKCFKLFSCPEKSATRVLFLSQISALNLRIFDKDALEPHHR